MRSGGWGSTPCRCSIVNLIPLDVLPRLPAAASEGIVALVEWLAEALVRGRMRAAPKAALLVAALMMDASTSGKGHRHGYTCPVKELLEMGSASLMGAATEKNVKPI